MEECVPPRKKSRGMALPTPHDRHHCWNFLRTGINVGPRRIAILPLWLSWSMAMFGFRLSLLLLRRWFLELHRGLYLFFVSLYLLIVCRRWLHLTTDRRSISSSALASIRRVPKALLNGGVLMWGGARFSNPGLSSSSAISDVYAQMSMLLVI